MTDAGHAARLWADRSFLRDDMLHAARSRAPKATLLVADATALPFKSPGTVC
jgi:ubiquinone/menaquinone biosynthesis C-methylase UbiE